MTYCDLSVFIITLTQVYFIDSSNFNWLFSNSTRSSVSSSPALSDRELSNELILFEGERSSRVGANVMDVTSGSMV